MSELESNSWTTPIGITTIVLIIVVALLIMALLLYAFYWAPNQFNQVSSSTSSSTSSSSSAVVSSSTLNLAGELTVGGLSTLNGGVKLPSTNSDGQLPSLLNFYAIDLNVTLNVSSLVVNFTTAQVSISRLGNMVTLIYENWVGSMTNSSGTIVASGIPADLTTPIQRTLSIATYTIENAISHAPVISNNTLIVELHTDGTMVFYPVQTTQFSGSNLGNNLLIGSFTITYPLQVTV